MPATERTNTVELAGEDLQDDQSERELAQAGSYICSLEGPLSRSDLDKFLWREDD